MKVALKLSFIKQTIDGRYYARLFNEFVNFTPCSFTKKYSTKVWDGKKHFKVLQNANNIDNIIISTRTNDILITTETGTKKPHRSVGLIQDHNVFFPNNKEIENLIDQDGFIAGYLYNDDYETVQSTIHSNNYDHRNYPTHILDSLKDTPWVINEFGEKQYDVKENPGKMDLIGYCWLTAAYKMWFGELFFKLVPKEKILSFPDAHKITEFEDGKVFVQLFEKIEESASAINMDIQRRWRKWLDFEKLIEQYK